MQAKLLVMVLTLISASAAWAGEVRMSVAPALGEASLVALGVGLVGAGLAILRRR